MRIVYSILMPSAEVLSRTLFDYSHSLKLTSHGNRDTNHSPNVIARVGGDSNRRFRSFGGPGVHAPRFLETLHGNTFGGMA